MAEKAGAVSTATLAGTCGLYCGACDVYRTRQDVDEERLQDIADRFGCAVEHIHCHGCQARIEGDLGLGCPFKACAEINGVGFCFQCEKLPCNHFTEQEPRYLQLRLRNLNRMRQVGVLQWLQEQEEHWHCPQCGAPTDLYLDNCRCCSEAPKPSPGFIA